MDTFLQDLRFSARTLLRRPGFTIAVALTLALGIGANTAIFSFVNGVLLRPLPYGAPRELMVLWTHLPDFGREAASYPDYVDWRSQNTVFAAMSAYSNSADNVAVKEGEPERLPSARITPDLFATLGLRPVIGRPFTADDAVFGSERVVILSHGLWMRRFGGDAAVVGKPITLNTVPYTIVGVAPPEMTMPARAQLWTPLAFNPARPPINRRNDFLNVVARLKPGVSEERAAAEMTAIGRRLAQAYPESNDRVGVDVVSLHDQLVGSVRTALLVFAAAVGFVLLIACANIANLLLARATARSREMAVRVALGARRQRIMRQLLTESVLLALIGGVAGVAFAVVGVAGLKQIAPASVPRLDEVGVDPTALGFALLVSLVTGVLFGLAPALQASSVGPAAALNAGGRAAIGGAADRLRSALVLAQVALALVLLAGSGLLLKSFQKLQHVDLGFDERNVLTAVVALPPAKYQDVARATDFFKRLEQRVATLPGVRAVGLTTDVPLQGGFNYITLEFVGRPAPRRGEPVPDAVPTSADSAYFSAMGLRLVEGRSFFSTDIEGAPRVAIVNQEMVRKHFGGRSPIGQRLTFGSSSDTASLRTIVGVVATTRLEGVGGESYPQVFYPIAQNPARAMYVVARTTGDPATMVAPLRREVVALDPVQPLSNVRTMEERVGDSIAQPRLTSVLVGVFAGVALLLAAVGIYGVISYSVAQRTREIGIRVALGASSEGVLRLIVRQGMTPVAGGLVLGLIAALAMTRLIAGILFGVSATDPLVFVGVTALLVIVAVVACLVPARRAAKVDPMMALRYE